MRSTVSRRSTASRRASRNGARRPRHSTSRRNDAHAVASGPGPVQRGGLEQPAGEQRLARGEHGEAPRPATAGATGARRRGRRPVPTSSPSTNTSMVSYGGTPHTDREGELGAHPLDRQPGKRAARSVTEADPPGAGRRAPPASAGAGRDGGAGHAAPSTMVVSQARLSRHERPGPEHPGVVEQSEAPGPERGSVGDRQPDDDAAVVAPLGDVGPGCSACTCRARTTSTSTSAVTGSSPPTSLGSWGVGGRGVEAPAWVLHGAGVGDPPVMCGPPEETASRRRRRTSPRGTSSPAGAGPRRPPPDPAAAVLEAHPPPVGARREQRGRWSCDATTAQAVPDR